MQKKILYIILLASLISCNEKKDKLILEDKNGSIYKVKNIESFFPENIESETQDTIIKNGNIEISVTQTSLKTFVIQKSQYRDFVDRKKLQYQTINRTEKNRDYEFHLKVKQNSKLVLDTIFRKEQFKDYCTKSYIEKSILLTYSFSKLSDGKLVFVVGFLNLFSSPVKTHQNLAFSHYYDLKERTFKIVRLKDG